MIGEMAEEEEAKTRMEGYGGMVRVLSEGSESAAEETLLLWCTQQPTYSQHNAFVSQSSLSLHLDACGHSLSILQSPSSLVIFLSFLVATCYLLLATCYLLCIQLSSKF